LIQRKNDRLSDSIKELIGIQYREPFDAKTLWFQYVFIFLVLCLTSI